MAAAAPQPVVIVLAAQATGMAASSLGWHAEGAAEPLIRLWRDCDQRLVEGGARVHRLEGEAAWLAWWDGAAGCRRDRPAGIGRALTATQKAISTP